VLWAIALISALAMAASTTFRGFSGIIAVDRDRARADALLAAGLEVSAGILMKFDDQPLTERATTISLSTGSVRLRLSDEGGRINVNKAPAKVLASLLRSVGAPNADALAKSIDIWRLRDQPAGALQPTPAAPNVATAPNVAMAPNVATQPGTPAPPGDAGAKSGDATQSFTDIRQLAQIPGMEPEYLAAITPLTTVFGDDKVNALTASADVLAALPEVNAGRLAAFLAARGQLPIAQDRLQQILGPMNDYVKLTAPPVALVELTARLIDGYTVAANAVVVVLHKDQLPYRVLAWTPAPLSERRSAAAASRF
jgi:general secretion pathway protein K